MIKRALLACLLALAGCQRDAPAPAVGKAFPGFMLDFVAPGAARQQLAGKLVVLNIWATWCPPCRREMPGLDHLARQLDPRRFAVIGLATDDDAALATEFLAHNGIGFPNFLDQGGAMAHRLGTVYYPETYLIAPDGTLLQRLTGFQEWNSAAMVERLERLYRQGAAR
ncbi:MAG: TlpA disulfide reductase family protein [Pseudomonadota bacterium]